MQSWEVLSSFALATRNRELKGNDLDIRIISPAVRDVHYLTGLRVIEGALVNQCKSGTEPLAPLFVGGHNR